MSVLHETSSGVDQRSQFFSMERTVGVSTGPRMVKLRIRIRADVYHPGQGAHHIDLWTDDGWKEVARIHGDDPDFRPPGIGGTPDVRRAREAFCDEVADNLVGRALAVLE